MAPSQDTYQHSADCPARAGIDLLSHTWTIVILNALRTGGMRPSALRRAIGGISQKVLTESLRRMERQHLVIRTVVSPGPPRVDYELTDLGRSLLGPLDTLADWVGANAEALAAIDL